MQIKYWPFNLKFRYPFTISKGTKTHQPTLVVELEHFGIKGYGEAPAIAYYNIPVEKMIEDIEAKKTMIEKFAFTDPERYWHYLHHLIPNNSFLVCALDIAAWDIYGKMKNKKLYEYVNKCMLTLCLCMAAHSRGFGPGGILTISDWLMWGGRMCGCMAGWGA